MTRRMRCRAVFLDAGGVIVLPDRHLLAAALADAGIGIDPDAVPSAHYRAVRDLDRSHYRATGPPAPPAPAGANPPSATYPQALFTQLGIVPERTAEAIAVWDRLADRRRATGTVLWSEPTPGAAQTIEALRRAGMTVVIVTNSDGHAAENLAACGFAGIPVIDSEIVGSRKPDARIFEAALRLGGATGAEVMHVGDTLASDVAGALAAAITPIHFDPARACRARDHRHIRSLPGIWQHVSITHPAERR